MPQTCLANLIFLRYPFWRFPKITKIVFTKFKKDFLFSQQPKERPTPRPPFFHYYANNFADLDECQTGAHDCHVHSRCVNVIGSYNCTCLPGYTGDGLECYGMKIFYYYGSLNFTEEGKNSSVWTPLLIALKWPSRLYDSLWLFIC